MSKDKVTEHKVKVAVEFIDKFFYRTETLYWHIKPELRPDDLLSFLTTALNEFPKCQRNKSR